MTVIIFVIIASIHILTWHSVYSWQPVCIRVCIYTFLFQWLCYIVNIFRSVPK